MPFFSMWWLQICLVYVLYLLASKKIAQEILILVLLTIQGVRFVTRSQ